MGRSETFPHASLIGSVLSRLIESMRFDGQPDLPTVPEQEVSGDGYLVPTARSTDSTRVRVTATTSETDTCSRAL